MLALANRVSHVQSVGLVEGKELASKVERFDQGEGQVLLLVRLIIDHFLVDHVIAIAEELAEVG